MPFTISHAAVVLPFKKKINQGYLIAAAVIGSMLPDLIYFLPLHIDRLFSHSLKAIFLFNIPMGFLILYAYNYFFKEAFVSLLPFKIQRRLSPIQKIPFSFNSVVLQFAFLFFGISSHIAWDSLTHSSGFFVRAIPYFNYSFNLFNRFELTLYSFLQIASSIIGLIFIFVHAIKWYQNSEQQFIKKPSLDNRLRRFIAIGIIILPALIPLLEYLFLKSPSMSFSFSTLFYYTIFTGGKILLIELFVWAVLWNTMIQPMLLEKNGETNAIDHSS